MKNNKAIENHYLHILSTLTKLAYKSMYKRYLFCKKSLKQLHVQNKWNTFLILYIVICIGVIMIKHDLVPLGTRKKKILFFLIENRSVIKESKPDAIVVQFKLGLLYTQNSSLYTWNLLGDPIE